MNLSNPEALAFFDAETIDVSAADKSPSLTGNGRKPAGLYVGTTGDLEVVLEGGQEVIFKSCPVGVLRVRVAKVRHAGTTASNILILYEGE